MKTCRTPHTDLVVSRIAYGAGALAAWDKNPVGASEVSTATRLIETALKEGINLFDHADLYAFGKCEAVFGEVLKRSPGLRDKLVIQSKCGQRFPADWHFGRPIRVDLSGKHIVTAVEGSLQRLCTDRLDILLLHAPDALVQPDEVAETFDKLHSAGKVRYFGVSNHNAGQIALLKKSVSQPLIVNQIQLGLATPDAIAEGMEFSLQIAKGGTGAESYTSLSSPGTLDFCRLNDIQIQAWSPLRGVVTSGGDAGSEVKPVARLLAELANSKKTTPAAVALAWLLRHPAGIVSIIGTGKPGRIVESCAADRIDLSRDEWYDLFSAATVLEARAIGG